jgi:hypothetical protein
MPPVRTIDDVIAEMRRIDAALPETDGVKWFNLLYLRVTETVKDAPPAGGWRDAAWLERLDVVFAQLYFDALENPATAPRSWQALFDLRRRQDIARIQFALAGMNAHINHDLAIALVQTSRERRSMPRRGSAQHDDFERVNTLLEAVEAQVKGFLLTGFLGDVDRHLGRVDDVIALFKVAKARDTAWTNAEILWRLRRLSSASADFLQSIDRLVGLSSRGLLAPTA